MRSRMGTVSRSLCIRQRMVTSCKSIQDLWTVVALFRSIMADYHLFCLSLRALSQAFFTLLMLAVAVLHVTVGMSINEGDGEVSIPGTLVSSASATVAITLECHMRKYNYKVVKTDNAGRQCWDYVGVMSCWGRCDSREISDWRFPYKRAHHPVCLHGVREPNTVTLRNCETGVEPGTERYEFLEALSCRCAVCKSSEASCETARFKTVRSLSPSSLNAPLTAVSQARARRQL